MTQSRFDNWWYGYHFYYDEMTNKEVSLDQCKEPDMVELWLRRAFDAGFESGRGLDNR